jgi:hypothetical protein
MAGESACCSCGSRRYCRKYSLSAREAFGVDGESVSCWIEPSGPMTNRARTTGRYFSRARITSRTDRSSGVASRAARKAARPESAMSTLSKVRAVLSSTTAASVATSSLACTMACRRSRSRAMTSADSTATQNTRPTTTAGGAARRLDIAVACICSSSLQKQLADLFLRAMSRRRDPDSGPLRHGQNIDARRRHR